ncbi:peroxiredoxin [Komagataeibacter sp. FNDCF1]|uniref:peroxiredoxin n=1 Tax=Komagataeibacter sp. FNDCF1 TaxID=2878681 RepID=UPI001E5ACA22|nr:peroxiredoxin [Komagataeibacter sp. FNDCF1]MCE2563217.1 peroxiredoxin [Komagataeibacter sp. FNDCF1]
MALFPGWQAPDFATDTTTGPIRFHAWGQDCWRIVLTHPGDYSLPSLRAALHRARTGIPDLRLLGLSPLSMPQHDHMPNGMMVTPDMPDFTIIHDDADHIRAMWQGIAVDTGPTGIPDDEHAVFIVDPKHVIRGTISYPPAPGLRDFEEVIRIMLELDNGCSTLEPTRYAA